MLEDSSQGVSALLRMPGMVVRAQVEVDEELWLAVETNGGGGRVRRVRHPSGGPRSSAGEGAGPARRRATGGGGVGQADLALPRSRL